MRRVTGCGYRPALHYTHLQALWDLANLDTGFAVVQTLATTLALIKGELNVLKGRAAQHYMFAATIFFFVCYLTAIFWCGHVGASLDKSSEDLYAWKYATIGRVCGVLIFAVLVSVAVWGRWHDEKKRLVRPNHPGMLAHEPVPSR
jgi:hypothetical protein